MKKDDNIREMAFAIAKRNGFDDLIKVWEAANFTTESIIGSILMKFEEELSN